MSPLRGLCADFQFGLLVSDNGIVNITHPSRYKRAESNLLTDEKRHQDRGQVVVWVIHLYLLHLFYGYV